MSNSDILKKSIIWTDPKMQRSYIASLWILPTVIYAIISLTSANTGLAPRGFAIFVEITMYMVLPGLLILMIANWRAKQSVKKLAQLVNNDEVQFVAVKVLPQSPLGRLHSKWLHGPGIRRAVDADDKKYWVPYRAKLDEEFKAKMYRIRPRYIPDPFVQTHAVVEAEKVA